MDRMSFILHLQTIIIMVWCRLVGVRGVVVLLFKNNNNRMMVNTHSTVFPFVKTFGDRDIRLGTGTRPKQSTLRVTRKGEFRLNG